LYDASVNYGSFLAFSVIIIQRHTFDELPLAEATLKMNKYRLFSRYDEKVIYGLLNKPANQISQLGLFVKKTFWSSTRKVRQHSQVLNSRSIFVM
jgi:hypothetical protein